MALFISTIFNWTSSSDILPRIDQPWPCLPEACNEVKGVFRQPKDSFHLVTAKAHNCSGGLALSVHFYAFLVLTTRKTGQVYQLFPGKGVLLCTIFQYLLCVCMSNSSNFIWLFPAPYPFKDESLAVFPLS